MASLRLEFLKKYQAEKEKSIEHAPKGKIHVAKGSRVQFYLRNETDEKYISKKQTKIIRTYLQKQYDERLLKIINKEISSIENLLEESNQSVLKIQQIYSKEPEEVKSYIEPIDVSDEDYVKDWIRRPFNTKMSADETTQFITNKGEYVRSKSELNIAK